MKRRCLADGCTILTDGARCIQHRREQRAKYSGDWPTISRQRITAHVIQHGYWCPGHEIEPHPSTDLTLDHASDQVLCRACNTRSKNLGHG